MRCGFSSGALCRSAPISVGAWTRPLLSAWLLDGQGLKTFTGAFNEGHAFDETPFARLVATATGADYHEIYLTPQDFAETLSKLIWHMDEPAAGPGLFPQHFVSRLARQHVKVVLGGQGG